MPLLLLLISVRGFEHHSGEDPGSRGLREEDTGGAPHSGAPLTSISLPPSFHSKPSTEGTMIWKRSAVLRFYSVCGLLLQVCESLGASYRDGENSSSGSTVCIAITSPMKGAGGMCCETCHSPRKREETV